MLDAEFAYDSCLESRAYRRGNLGEPRCGLPLLDVGEPGLASLSADDGLPVQSPHAGSSLIEIFVLRHSIDTSMTIKHLVCGL